MLAPLASPSSSSSSEARREFFFHRELAERAVLGFKFCKFKGVQCGGYECLFSVW
jgi:Cys-tRNA synthase (O-phospho-L-seryl-tRNA:Cys-tRNA synthase)